MPRPLALVSFIALVCAFLALANYVVFDALALVFDPSIWQQIVIILILGALSAGFVALTILGNWYYNWFTTTLYTVTAVWMGLMVYLFFTSVLLSLIVLFFPSSAFSIGIVLLAGSVITSIYGVVQGQRIKIKSHDIALQNVPHVWRGKKAVWVSDLHLGQLRSPKFAAKVAKKVSALAPDIIFIGGDLYDGARAIDANFLIEPLKNLTAPLGVLFITGNHEEFGDSKKYTSAVEALGMRVLRDELIEIDGLQIVGVDWSNASKSEQFVKILSSLPIDRNKATILLKHEPQDLGVSHEAGINFQISGHTHKAQQWPLGYIARIAYNGYEYGLKKYKEMQVYVSSGTGTWGPPLRVGSDCEIVIFTFI